MTRAVCLLALALGCGTVQNGEGGGNGDGGTSEQNEAPTDVELSASSVEEQAPPGTHVGLLTAVDPDASDHHTFELTADGDGQFAIDGAALVVAPNAILNSEGHDSRTAVVPATAPPGAAAIVGGS